MAAVAVFAAAIAIVVDVGTSEGWEMVLADMEVAGMPVALGKTAVHMAETVFDMDWDRAGRVAVAEELRIQVLDWVIFRARTGPLENMD